MALFRLAGAVVWSMFVLTGAVKADESSFNNYVEGALSVYSTFAEPSKQQSEQFYAFIQNKWKEQSKCAEDCKSDGARAGKEYVWKMNIQLDSDKS